MGLKQKAFKGEQEELWEKIPGESTEEGKHKDTVERSKKETGLVELSWPFVTSQKVPVATGT